MSQECIHLLNPDWCADCNGTAAQQDLDEKTERQRILALPGWFPANYPSKCRMCRTSFRSGDPIRRAITPGGYIGPCCAPAGDPA